ncbi:hypothetical protein CCP3SC1AL1_1590009 [Gammaproteobacteria bacterium]
MINYRTTIKTFEISCCYILNTDLYTINEKYIYFSALVDTFTILFQECNQVEIDYFKELHDDFYNDLCNLQADI